MITLNEFIKKTTELSIKLPPEDIINITVKLYKITPAERAKYFDGGEDAINLQQIRSFLTVIIDKWDVKLNADDTEFLPITEETFALFPDRCLVIIYEKILEASSKIEGELLR